MAMQGGEYWTTSGQAGGDDRIAHWQDMLSATHLPWTVQVDPQDDAAPFEAWVRRWWIDDLALVDCECSPCSGTRQRRHLADTDGEFVDVLITRAGRETVSSATPRRSCDRATPWCGTAPSRPGSTCGSR